MVKEFLFSDKKIYDSIHGFIRFDEFEKILIDSFPFQRLHYIHQLGIAYLVYPGATHSRFAHSLGVMEVASRMFYRICKSVRPDLFHFVPRRGSSEYIYWEKVLRLAALCHDLGHLPFSHVAEREILGEEGHEKWTLKIIESSYLEKLWEQLDSKPTFRKDFIQKDIKEDVTKVAIGEEKLNKLKGGFIFSSWEKILSQIITGDFFGSDRIDYLIRDAKFTGVVYGLFDYLQLIEMLRILPSCRDNSTQLELGIDENGIESCEALLLARHFMYKRVYQYSPIKAFTFHLRNFLKIVYSKKELLEDLDEYLHMSDIDIIHALNRAFQNKKDPGFEEAKRILNRKERFKAICLPKEIREEDLMEFREKHNIAEDQIKWEIYDPAMLLYDLSFPVSKRQLAVQKAKDCSDLLSYVPSVLNNWVYIAPQYEILFFDTFKES